MVIFLIFFEEEKEEGNFTESVYKTKHFPG